MSTKALLEELRSTDVRLEAEGLTLNVDAPAGVDLRGNECPPRTQACPDPSAGARTPQAGGGGESWAGHQVVQEARLPLAPRPHNGRLARAHGLRLPSLHARRRENVAAGEKGRTNERMRGPGPLPVHGAQGAGPGLCGERRTPGRAVSTTASRSRDCTSSPLPLRREVAWPAHRAQRRWARAGAPDYRGPRHPGGPSGGQPPMLISRAHGVCEELY